MWAKPKKHNGDLSEKKLTAWDTYLFPEYHGKGKKKMR
jgi:hypothetical protein